MPVKAYPRAKHTVSLLLPVADYKALKEKAVNEDRTVPQILRMLIRGYIQNAAK